MAKNSQQDGTSAESKVDSTDSPAKVEAAVETEPMTEERPSIVRKLTTPPLSRHETADSVEIVGDVLA